jgi:uncharacterized SAM-binding protein YcdF (DUF218 family)
VFLLQLASAIIGPPKRLVEWLNATELEPQEPPRYIVVLGGGGIPSPSSLQRTYYAARFGRGLTNATFIVSLPADKDPAANSVGRMRDELVLRGIPANTILMETRGRNTHEQAVNVARLLGPDALRAPVLIVTSSFHMRRAVLLFRKAGFTRVSALVAYSVEAEADMGPFTWLRYGIWSHGETELRILRELISLATCKLRGWI